MCVFLLVLLTWMTRLTTTSVIHVIRTHFYYVIKIRLFLSLRVPTLSYITLHYNVSCNVHSVKTEHVRNVWYVDFKYNILYIFVLYVERGEKNRSH